MASTDDRKQFRRKAERRKAERRQLDLEFMSPEWLKRVQEEHLLWPKKDRRVNDRRNAPRRKNARRIKSAQIKRQRNIADIADLLTAEEKQMLHELSKQNKVE